MVLLETVELGIRIPMFQVMTENMVLGAAVFKDIQALINFAELRDIDLNVVRGAWETNLNVGPEKDWELLKGRAIVDE